MRKLILKMSMSLDGFVCGPKGEMDWFYKSRSPEGAAWLVEKFGQAGAHLMGRKTFNVMAGYWPGSKDVVAASMNEVPKIVFSKTGFDPSLQGGNAASPLPPSANSWKEARVITGDLADGIRLLKKEEGKDLVAHGGAGFAQSLVQTGLMDEFWLVTHPVAIGQGLGLFAQLKTPLHLKLVETKTFSAGTFAHIYQPE